MIFKTGLSMSKKTEIDIYQIDSDVEKTSYAIFSSSDRSMIDPYIRYVQSHMRSLPRDVSTKEGQDLIRSEAHKLAKLKNAIKRIGQEELKKSKETSIKISSNIDIWFKEIDDLQKWYREPLTDLEEKIKAEQEEIKEHIAKYSEVAKTMYGKSSDQIRELISQIDSLHQSPPDCLANDEKAKDQVDQIYKMNRDMLGNELDLASKRESEQEELNRLRVEAEKRAKEDEVRALKEQAAKEEKEKAELIISEKEKQLKEAEIAKHIAENEAKKMKEQAENAAQEMREKMEAEARLKLEQEKARAADVEHRGAINSAVVDDLMSAVGLSKEQASAVVIAIVRGQISHTKIQY